MRDLGLFFLVLCAVASSSARFHVIREWKYVNFTWPSDEAFDTALSKGLYIPENNVIAGVKYFDGFYYITLPRMKKGVPATLTRIPAGAPQDLGRPDGPVNIPDPSPRLQPFPSWAMNTEGDCDALQNVQNVEVDPKGQLWIIDGGRTQTLTSPVVKCPPKLVVFDIGANRVDSVHNFPEEIAAMNGSFLYDLVVDHTDGGYAYITDNSATDPGIIVFSVAQDRSWKIRHARSMRADPSASQFSTNGIFVTAAINIAGIALGPQIHASNQNVRIQDEREVYFTPLSSLKLFSVNTTVLRNENLARSNANLDEQIKDIGVKASQTVGMVMDNQGVLYYGLLGNNAVSRWDSHTSFSSGQRLIGQDDKYIDWPNSFTLEPSGNLTVITNRLEKFIFDRLDLNQANFRLLTSHVGGKSYLYDDNFDYQPSQSTNDHPEPEPEPEPSSSSTSSTTMSSSTATSTSSAATKSSTTSSSSSSSAQSSSASQEQVPPSAASKPTLLLATVSLLTAGAALVIF